MGNEVTIAVPSDDELGPAMKALNPRQRAFVVAYFATGSREAAARAAGYSSVTENSLNVAAFQVWHQPKVQEALTEFGHRSILNGLLPFAMKAAEEILADAGHKDRARVLQMVFDRTGFHAKSELTVTHEDGENRKAMISRLVYLALKNGDDPRKVIGNLADVTDADYEMIPAEESKPAPSAIDDLEDVL